MLKNEDSSVGYSMSQLERRAQALGALSGTRRDLGYDFPVPATCAALNATAVKPPKIIESSEGRRARRAARLANAARRRKKPSVPTKERVPKWVHVVEE